MLANRDEYFGERTAAPLSVASRATRCETWALVTMVWTHDHVGLHLNAPKNNIKKVKIIIKKWFDKLKEQAYGSGRRCTEIQDTDRLLTL